VRAQVEQVNRLDYLFAGEQEYFAKSVVLLLITETKLIYWLTGPEVRRRLQREIDASGLR
jgi:hypothetical protein